MAVLTGCAGRTDNGKIVINLDKPSSKGINLKEYCEKIEIISLDETQGLFPKSKFCVFDKGYVMYLKRGFFNFYWRSGTPAS